MKTLGFVCLSCLFPAALCWEFPGSPGVDCPSARQMSEKPGYGWMLPKCFANGTYQPLQCYDNYTENPDSCMCCALDGTPITLPGFGLNVKTCDCLLAQHKAFEQILLLLEQPAALLQLELPKLELPFLAEMPKCENDGTFAALQCSEDTKKCWCVDKKGNVVVPPSTDVHSCENSID